jgi:peptidylprolyl isomerase
VSANGRSRSTRTAALLAIAAGLLIAGCGDDGGRVISDGAAEFDKGAEVATTTTAPPPVCPAEVPEGLEKPEVAPLEGDPPTELQVEDMEPGDGEELVEGAPACFHYVLVAASTGDEIDASWDRETPFETTIGAGGNIAGFEQGVVGMKVGGRRRLVIPPDLGYGEAGSPPAGIGPNETLIYVVDLLGVGEPPPATTTTTTTAPEGGSTTTTTTTAPG